MSSLENRMSVLETDVKAIKQITEKTHKMHGSELSSTIWKGS